MKTEGNAGLEVEAEAGELGEEMDDFEGAESTEATESTETTEKKVFKLPDWLENLSSDRRQTILNLRILVSREYFFKRNRQAAKNFLASLKNHLKDKGWEYTKIHKIEDQIKVIDKIIVEIEKDISIELATLPIYTRFLKNVKGVGPWIAGAVIAQVGFIERFHSISALRKYSGWYPVDGKAFRRAKGQQAGISTKMHQVLYHFVEGITKAKDEVYYNDLLRYRKAIYDKHPEYADRKATKKQKIDGIPSHTLKMARRKTIQKFIADLFCVWRDLEGLPQTVPYAIGILGHEGFINPLTENKHYEKEVR